MARICRCWRTIAELCRNSASRQPTNEQIAVLVQCPCDPVRALWTSLWYDSFREVYFPENVCKGLKTRLISLLWKPIPQYGRKLWRPVSGLCTSSGAVDYPHSKYARTLVNTSRHLARAAFWYAHARVGHRANWSDQGPPTLLATHRPAISAWSWTSQRCLAGNTTADRQQVCTRTRLRRVC
jgi:hypothetical protein